MGGFWDDFSGKSQREDIQRGNEAAGRYLKYGYNTGQGYYDKAYDEYAPYAEVGAQGQADNDVYRHAIGLGTDDERVAAQDRYFTDPALGRMMQPQVNAMQRYLNARGSGGGGKAQLASARVANENYGGWLDRVRDTGQNAMTMGFNAANARSGIRQGQGDFAWGYGATRAGNAITQGNAMAQSRSTLSNNLLGVAGVAANAYANRPRAA